MEAVEARGWDGTAFNTLTGVATGAMNGPTRRRTVKGLGALLLGSSVAGCMGDGGGNGGGGTTTITMTNDLVFEPAELTVTVGETVTWENVGTVTHTVTAYGDKIPDGATYFASGGFDTEQAARDSYPDTGGIGEGQSYVHSFETAGTVEYFCIPHEANGMTGTITVEEE